MGDNGPEEDVQSGPIVLKRVNRHPWRTGFLMVWMAAMYCLIVAATVISALDPGGSPFGPLIMTILLLVTSPIMVRAFRDSYNDLLEEAVILEVDGLRTMKGERVLMELPFDEGTSVEVFFQGDRRTADHVRTYRFLRRRWEGTSISDLDYSLKDLARMWPVVRAAVRKHGMRTVGDLPGPLMEIND